MLKVAQQMSGRVRTETLSSGLFLLQLVPGGHLDLRGPSRTLTGIFVVSAVLEPCLEETCLEMGLERTGVPKP